MPLDKKTYAFGGIAVQIVSPIALRHDAKYEIFRAPDDVTPDYILQMDPLPAGCAEGRQNPPIKERDGNRITISLAEDILPNLTCTGVFAHAGLPFLFLEKEAFVLHASYILRDGRAVLFTAPSGVGKSTQATLWKEHRGAEVVNGDRVLITSRQGEFFANGIYMSGKSGQCQNITAPIDRVILLEQGESNELCAIRPHSLYLRIMCQCTYDIQSEIQCEQIGTLLSDLFARVPVHCYRCRNHPDSVDDLERLIWKEKHK